MTSPTDIYAALSPTARLVAQIYGVVAPHAVSIQRTAKVLRHTGVELLGKALTETDVRRSNQELVDAGIGQRSARPTDTRIRASPHWAVLLTREAEQAGRLQPILSGFEATRTGRRSDPFMYETLFRCYVVADDFLNLDYLVGDEPSGDDWRFLAEPLAADILARLPVRHIDHALTGCLRHVIETAGSADAVLAACRRLATGPGVHAADIALVHVLKGQFQAADDVFAGLPKAVREHWQTATARAATRALIALLRGDDLGARRGIEECMTAAKAGTRRRNVFPEESAFALSLLSLVRDNSPESHALVAQLLRTAERRGIAHHGGVTLVADALCAQSGNAVYAHGTNVPCLEVLFDGLRYCWIGRRPHGRDTWRTVMDAYRRRAARNGFAWVSAECASTLSRIDGRRGEHDADVDPKPLHAALGTTTLAQLAAAAPAWERSLRALEQVAYDARQEAGRGNKRAKASAFRRRLTWDIVEVRHSIRLSPREQRETKGGTWSKGRKVALRRLAAQAGSMDFLREEDLAAAAAIAVQRNSGDSEYVLGNRGLFALAGHPYVFNQVGEPVEVVRCDPELRVDHGKGGRAVVTLAPRGRDSEDEYGVARVSDNRYEVTRFTSEHHRLFNIIPREGLEIPGGGKSRLLEAVSGLAGQVRVQSATGTVQAIAEVAADAAPWVRLEPFDAGLTVALMVEPIAGAGIFFEPGAGGATVFANQDGEDVQARRDLGAEREALAALIEACPRLTTRPTEYAPLLLPEPFPCLELLEQLEAAGARCKWPKGEPFRMVARRSASALSMSLKTADEWLQASAKLVVDDDTVLDLKRLFALLEANPGSRFLELDDGEFLALTNAFRRQLKDLWSLSTDAADGAVRIHAFAAAALDDLLAEADVERDDGSQALRARLEAARNYEPVLPNTLQAELRPYQVEGYRWLARLGRWGAGACLADDMGLGKTVQTLTVLLDRAPGGPALVVAPTSVVANWTDEARRFAPTLNVKPYTGSTAARMNLLDGLGPFDVYVTTYGVLQNDTERLAQIHWHTAVLDEAQAIKNPAAKRARAAKRLRADFRIVTTGTPIQNNLMDLHSLFGFLNPGLLGSQARFRAEFAERAEFDTRERLRRIIAPFILRRRKTEVLDDLPERTEITLHVALSPEEAALYETLRQRAVEEMTDADDSDLNPGERGIALLAHLTRLRLACCNPRLVLEAAHGAPGSSKLKAFADTLDELLRNRHKVLVFSQFVRHLKLVEEYLNEAGVPYQYLDGSTPPKVRSERIAAFQSGDGDVFLISVKAGGVGLNLTAADYVIHMDPWWNPAVEDQASDRAHRIGQTRPVTIYRLVADGTIEEQIVELHRHKRHLAEQLLEGSDASGRLSTDELLELLRQPMHAME